MSLGKELAKLKFDKRLTEWHVNTGKLAKDDLKKHLDSLPDLASNIDSFGLAGGSDDDLDDVSSDDQDSYSGSSGSGF